MGGKSLNTADRGHGRRPHDRGYSRWPPTGALRLHSAVPRARRVASRSELASVVGMTFDYATGGYYKVATNGGLFTLNTAPFHGSEGGKPLNEPIVSVTIA